MSTTPHLALPLLAAAQAQKHVTHNEAIASLDALVQLSLKERDRTLPPASPEEGDRYLVGAGGSGAFSGHDGEVALFDLGTWRFFTPRPGWCAYVEAEGAFIAYDGAAWADIGRSVGDLGQLDRLGIGTAADDLNRLAAKLNAALFAARAVEEGGTGDLRFVLNKPEPNGVVSQLYQTGYSGRAETGLIGSDDFRVRVSPDGSGWRDAMIVDRGSGTVSFPMGVTNAPGVNLLMNGDFLVNQRAFAGGSLATGSYGFDRWRAGPGGFSLTRSADGTMLLFGSLEQVVDVSLAGTLLGLQNFAGCTLTLSAEDVSRSVALTLGSRAATLPAGSGRCAVTVTLGSEETGHILLQMTNWSGVNFRRMKLELGPCATPWSPTPVEVEELRCRRYYQRLPTNGGPPGMVPILGLRKGANMIDIPWILPVSMAAGAGIASGGIAWTNASPGINQIGFLDQATGSWTVITGSLTLTTAAPIGPSSAILRLQAGTSFNGSAGNHGYLHLGNMSHIGLQADI